MKDLQGFLDELQLNINKFSNSDDVYKFIIKIMSKFGISITNEEALIFAKKFTNKYRISDSLIKNKKDFEEFKNDTGEYYPYIYNFDEIDNETLEFYYKMWVKNKAEVLDVIKELEAKGYVNIKDLDKSLPQPKRTKTMIGKGIYPDAVLRAKLKKNGTWETFENRNEKYYKVVKSIIENYDGILKYAYDLDSKHDDLVNLVTVDYDEFKGSFFTREKPGYLGISSGDLKGTSIYGITLHDKKFYVAVIKTHDTRGFW